MNDGGPAFPTLTPAMFSSTAGEMPKVVEGSQYHEGGMSLRDWFAGQAMAYLPLMLMRTDANTRPGEIETSRKLTNVPQVAEWAYEIADALLTERAKETQHGD